MGVAPRIGLEAHGVHGARPGQQRPPVCHSGRRKLLDQQLLAVIIYYSHRLQYGVNFSINSS